MEDSVQEFISSGKCPVAQDSSLNQFKGNIIVKSYLLFHISIAKMHFCLCVLTVDTESLAEEDILFLTESPNLNNTEKTTLCVC